MAESSAETEIAAQVPRLYSFLQSHSPLNWVDIRSDLQALNWLKPTIPHVASLCQNILQIVDLWAFAKYSSEPHFSLLKLNEVQMFLNEVFDSFAVLKTEMRDAHTVVKAKIADLGFFKGGETRLGQISDRELPGEVEKLAEIFEEMKDTLQCFFFHLRPSFQAEINKDIDDVLDEQFFRQVLEPVKSKLSGEEKTAEIYKKFDRSYSGSLLAKPRSLFAQMWTTNYAKETIYFGEFDAAGLKHGFGRITYSNGDSYEGCWSSDRFDGKGVYRWQGCGSYEGDFQAGKMHGEGRRVYQSGNIYKGIFADGKKHGKGTMVFKNGDQYEGDWVENMMHGLGTYTWSSGSVYSGSFCKDKREGRGRLVLGPEDVYEGEWTAGRFRPA